MSKKQQTPGGMDGNGNGSSQWSGHRSVPPFAELVRRYVEERGLSLDELAALLQTGPAEVSQWLHGVEPDVASVIRFAHLAGLDWRAALASAGLWPEEVPLEQPTREDYKRAAEVAATIVRLPRAQREALIRILSEAAGELGRREA